MQTPFFHRLYVRIWLAVALALAAMALLVWGLIRVQSERLRDERLADVPAREVVIRNAQGQEVGAASVRPVRVPGRGVEFHIQLPEGVKGGEQVAISLPPRPRAEAGGPRHLPPRGWLHGNSGAFSPWVVALLLIGLAAAVAMVSYPVVRRLTRRLEGLQQGVERLGAGDWRARVDDCGHDEAAFLARRFNRAADQIEALIHAQKSLLANASHELRSPLTRIRMGIELMPSGPAAVHHEIARSIAELDALIDEILLASRLEARTNTSNSVNFADCDVLALALEETARAELQLTWQGKLEHARLSGEAKLLRRMLRNLLENAKRYGGADVSVTLGFAPETVRIEVADRGPGVPPEERERIFEPFYRSRHAAEHHGSVGLGLALVRGIARQHGGDARCLDRPGGGACFVVQLPRRSPR